MKPALASPADYFEMTFTAEAGIPYHLWIRGRAAGDHYANDSVHVQFSGALDSSGAPAYRIGTTASAEVILEDGRSAGLGGWGWQDNGWGNLGPHLYFETSGPQTIRVQRREDGLSIDQIVLSPGAYLQSSPGATKYDSTILPESGGGGGGDTPVPSPPPPPPLTSAGDVVLYAAGAALAGGGWTTVADASAAGGSALLSPNLGAGKIVTAQASPATYAELTFNAEVGRAYRVWLRARAEGNYWGNDSVHLQFSGTVDSAGSPAYRIGTTDSAVVNLEDCSGCGLSGWGWQDNGWGSGVLGPPLFFESTGTQTLRIQIREDGLRIDQVVLSPDTYVNAAPGALRNDATILPASD